MRHQRAPPQRSTVRSSWSLSPPPKTPSPASTQRLARSPLRDGFNARAHFHDACASLSLAGAFVPLEVLILHDAEMDLRAPTHELARAHTVLRARRRIAAAAPGVWLACGLDALRTGRDRQDVGQEEGRETDPIEFPYPPPTIRSLPHLRRSTPRLSARAACWPAAATLRRK